MWYKLLADMHTHTIFSEHALSTLKENVTEATNKNLSYLAVTDHFYEYKADLTANDVHSDRGLAYIHNKNLRCRLEHTNDCRLHKNEAQPMNIINGVELNLGEDIMTKIDTDRVLWRLMGWHSWFLNVSVISDEALFAFWKNSLQTNAPPTAFAHIERKLDRLYDYDKNIKRFLYNLVDLAVDNNIYLELNESSICENEEARDGNLARMNIWVPYALEKGAKFSMGSDAHYCDEVGCFDNVWALIKKYKIPNNRILNCNAEELNKFCLN